MSCIARTLYGSTHRPSAISNFVPHISAGMLRDSGHGLLLLLFLCLQNQPSQNQEFTMLCATL